MYDTVSVLWREPTRKFVDAFPWNDQRRRVTDRGVMERLSGGPKGGPHVILHPDGTAKIERSLPKSLTGQNAEDLTQADVPDALASVDRELAALVPGIAVPSIGEMTPYRVDYCESINMGAPALVDIALARLAATRVARKGYPVRGESGSVSWTRGALRIKAYNKGREDGDPTHLALFRLEPALYGSATFRTIPGLVGPDDRTVTLRHVLTEQVRSGVFDRVWSLLDGGIPVSSDDMGDVAFVSAFVSFFGPRRAAAIIGYCVVWSMAGIRQPQDVTLENRPTYYRVLADIRRFRDHHSDLGRAPVQSNDLPYWVRDNVGKVA